MMSDRSKYYFCSPIRITRTRDQGPADQGPGPAEEGMGPVALLRSWNGDTVSLDPGLDTSTGQLVGQIVKIANKLVGM